MRIAVRHTTAYRFDKPVPYGLQRLRVTPKNGNGQSVVDWKTRLSAGEITLSYRDHHNNHVDLALFEPNTTEIEIISEGIVETSDKAGIIGVHGGHMALWMFLRPTPMTEAGRGIAKLAKTIKDPEDVGGLHALSERILEAMPYDIGDEESFASAEEALERGHGVCMDHAHVMIAVARRAQIPARYVSGYLLVDDKSTHAASHAWAELHVDGLGWVGFDVSNQVSPDERYVRIATGFDYHDVAPVTGMSFGDHNEKLVVTINVEQ